MYSLERERERTTEESNLSLLLSLSCLLQNNKYYSILFKFCQALFLVSA
jgi:hypothetical protein